ncbi:rcc01693 family protein [Parvibaculum sp. MBR-TMA-1.3b-4.2]
MTSFPSSRFPWENAMTIGMGLLRLPPETFWRMTLPELSAAAGMVNNAQGSITREELAELAAMFPDRQESC